MESSINPGGNVVQIWEEWGYVYIPQYQPQLPEWKPRFKGGLWIIETKEYESLGIIYAAREKYILAVVTVHQLSCLSLYRGADVTSCDCDYGQVKEFMLNGEWEASY
jgi:hypothetical protein